MNKFTGMSLILNNNLTKLIDYLKISEKIEAYLPLNFFNYSQIRQ